MGSGTSCPWTVPENDKTYQIHCEIHGMDLNLMEGNDFWIVDQNHFDEIEKMNDREASRDRFWPVRWDVPNQAFYGFWKCPRGRKTIKSFWNYKIRSGGGCDRKSIGCDGFGNGKFSPGPSPWPAPVGPDPNGLGKENGPFPFCRPVPVRPLTPSPGPPLDSPWITVGFLKSNGSKCDFDWSVGGLKISKLYLERVPRVV